MSTSIATPPKRDKAGLILEAYSAWGPSPLSSQILSSLEAYIALLLRWGEGKHLFSRGHADIEGVTLHIIDILRVLPLLPEPSGGRILDWGSGAGLPGLVLAIARPSWSLVLLDRRGSKARLLKRLVEALELPNVQVLEGSLEPLLSKGLALGAEFDTIISRAVMPLKEALTLLGPWLLSRKGRSYWALCGPEADSVAQGGIETRRIQLEEAQMPLKRGEGEVLALRLPARGLSLSRGVL